MPPDTALIQLVSVSKEKGMGSASAKTGSIVQELKRFIEAQLALPIDLDVDAQISGLTTAVDGVAEKYKRQLQDNTPEQAEMRVQIDTIVNEAYRRIDARKQALSEISAHIPVFISNILDKQSRLESETKRLRRALWILWTGFAIAQFLVIAAVQYLNQR
jgi:hypothetical protein